MSTESTSEIVWVNAEVFSQGRGHVPWWQSLTHPRVILDAQGSVVGTMDTADLAAKVVEAVNARALG